MPEEHGRGGLFSGWLELYQGYLRRDILEYRDNLHVYLGIFNGAFHEVGDHHRAFVQLDHGIDIRGVIPECLVPLVDIPR